MTSAEQNETQSQEKRIRSFHPKGNGKPRQKNRQEAAEQAPPVFHAHALDLDPNIVIPERPSVDLTYNDFTRSAIEGELKQPKVRKRKPLIPFELTETPRLNADQWEGRPPGRRKLMAAAEEAAEENKGGENKRGQDSRKGKDRQERPERQDGRREDRGERQGGQKERQEGHGEGWADERNGSRKPRNNNQPKKGGAQGQRPHPENRPQAENKGNLETASLEGMEAPAAREENQGEGKKGKGFWAKRREDAKRRKEQQAQAGAAADRPEAPRENPGPGEAGPKPKREGRRPEGEKPARKKEGDKKPGAQNQNRRPQEQGQRQDHERPRQERREQRPEQRPENGQRHRQEKDAQAGESQSLIKPYWIKKQ